MFLFHPTRNPVLHGDPATAELVRKTVDFFESRGLARLKAEDQAGSWYQDFMDFLAEHRPLATLLTPQAYGTGAARFDVSRLAEFNEVLAFYSLAHWYTWQVSILGLGPIWMGQNEEAKRRAATLLRQGAVFAFGLSEKEHGADIYGTEMELHPQADGTFLARGSKYYIGNGNCAALVSVFGRVAGTEDYVFFTVRPDHPAFTGLRKIDTSGVRRAYVAEFRLQDYPVTPADILSRGKAAWESSLNTVNVGKFQLGCASLGIATHALYEALHHAAHRRLYGNPVTHFPHVQRTFSEAYLRVVAMKLVARRAADYLRSASDQDRRYLLFNPIVKMKVTGQGERVVALLHDVIAAKGFEQDTWFEMAIRDVGMLPKLEGTEHVNMALVTKFTRNYFFGPVDCPAVPTRADAADDAYLFHQFTGKLAEVRFPDWKLPYQGVELPNAQVFRGQVETFRTLLATAPPSAEQARNVDYMLAGGELTALAAYAQLVLENARLLKTDPDTLDGILGLLVKDFSAGALRMVLDHDNSPEQERLFRDMVRKPVREAARTQRVWEQVLALADAYTMQP